jgi:uncharacterized membrane protein
MYDDFDLAIHSQSIYAILRGSSFSSIIGIPFLGNHMVLILYPLALVAKIIPAQQLLLWLQSVLLAAGAWPIFALSRRELSPRWGVCLAITYLIYPPLIFMNLYEFHPIALASSFILYALLFWKNNRFILFLTMLLLAAACQENIALMSIGFGLWGFFERKRWWWIALPIVFGLLYFYVVVVKLLPQLNDSVGFISLYAQFGDSIPQVILGIATHPLKTLQIMTQPQKINFIRSLMAPLGFLPLLSPLTWIPALPIAAQRLLSNRATEFVIVYHYQAEFIPFVFFSAIYAIKRLRQSHLKALNILPVIILATFPLLALTISLTELVSRTSQQQIASPSLIKAQQNFIREVPSNASVVATFQLLAPLAKHQNLHSIHHITTGCYTLSGKNYPIPENIDIIAINTMDRLTFMPNSLYTPSIYLQLQQLLATGHWQIMTQEENFLALHRSASDDPQLPLARPVTNLPSDASANILQGTNATIHIIAFRLIADKDSDILDLYWRTTAPCYDTDAAISISIQDSTYSAIIAPGSRFWPPQCWPTNSIIRDRHRIPHQPLKAAAKLSVTLLPRCTTTGSL